MIREDASNKSVQKRTRSNKEELIQQLRKTPIVQVACSKTGVGRATYYAWRKKDEKFATLADESIREGIQFVNDMAESQLLSAIKDRNMTAIIYWLKHRHKAYSTKVELSGRIQHEPTQLSPMEEELIKKAVNLIAPVKKGRKNDN